ncbi:MAG TPA: hypothetical protein ENI87_11290 [bacterium]|nr:hypothetical protein [bacterium]
MMPIEAVSGLMAAGDDGRFRAVAAETPFAARQVLFGSYATRALLDLPEVAQLAGRGRSGRFSLLVPSAELRLVLGFREARQRALALLAEARSAWQEGRPGAALDRLTELFETAPMDSEQLAKAQQLRNELLTEQARRSAQLRRDLEEANFFETRGGYERVASGVDELIALYGEQNVEDLAGLERLRATARERLQALDRAALAPQRQRLTALADAFADAGQTELEKIVRSYVARHLPDAPPASESGAGGGGSGNE